jgi:hypothetical protein
MYLISGARGSVDGCGAVLQARKSRVQVQVRLLHFFQLANPFSRTMALEFTQPVTEMSTKRYSWE